MTFYKRVVRVEMNDASYIEELLAAGWEPFAATSIGTWDYIWFRLPDDNHS